jgi:hypothetical protein
MQSSKPQHPRQCAAVLISANDLLQKLNILAGTIPSKEKQAIVVNAAMQVRRQVDLIIKAAEN